jgi:hypothetical protein
MKWPKSQKRAAVFEVDSFARDRPGPGLQSSKLHWILQAIKRGEIMLWERLFPNREVEQNDALDEYDTPELKGCPAAVMKYLRDKDHRSFSGRAWRHIDEIYGEMNQQKFSDQQITETLTNLWKKLGIIDIYPSSNPKWIRRHKHSWE